jgi:cytoskeletal protein CcmA (bactofilin family)
MQKTIKIFTPFILLALLFVPTRSVQAQGPGPDGGGQVLFGTNFTLESGDTFDGDLVLLGGNVTIEEDAVLNGDLVVIGGTIRSDGETNGDVVVVGGQVRLEDSARVSGDVVTIGGQLDQAEGAEVEGDVVNNVAPNITFPRGRIPPTAIPDLPGVPPIPNVPDVPVRNVNIDFFPFRTFVWIIGLPAFAMLLALFWQPQIERTGKAIIAQPLTIGAIGLLSVVVAAILFFTVLLPLTLALAWVFGVVAMGSEVGERFEKAVNQQWSPVLTAGFGTFLLVMAGTMIGWIPCLGGLILFLFGLVGIGASVITLFGTRPVQIPALNVYTSPTTPPAGPGQAPGGDAPVG